MHGVCQIAAELNSWATRTTVPDATSNRINGLCRDRVRRGELHGRTEISGCQPRANSCGRSPRGVVTPS